MKKDSTTKFIGLDVHSKTISVAIADEGREGEVRHYGTIENTFEAIDKVIYVPVSATGPVALGIFFEPLSDKKTKVSFVKSSFSGSAINQGVIYAIPEEVNYLLRHGKQSYLEYTHKLAEETAKKHQEELNAP